MTYAKMARVKNLCLQYKIGFHTDKTLQGEYQIILYHRDASTNITTISYELAYCWIKKEAEKLKSRNPQQKFYLKRKPQPKAKVLFFTIT